MKSSVSISLAIVSASLVLGLSSPAHSAYVVNFVGPGNDATALANNLLAGSSGITIVNSTYTGFNGASGTFTGGGIFGIESGVVLTSGSASHFGIPNNNGVAGYAPLENLNGNRATFDASVLDIKFVPTGSSVTFRYVFASEEYPVYVNSTYNDVFGFFVNGTAVSNNQAKIPGTSTPVAINTVNCGDFLGAGPSHCDLFIDNRKGDKGIFFTDLGGWTVPFSFVASVNPGVQNELILAIADTSDAVLDSAAFIESGTFAVCGGPGQPSCSGTGGGTGGGSGTGVPEPDALALLGIGVGALGISRRRKKA